MELIFFSTVSGFKETQIARSSKQSVYCNAVFAGWDYSILEAEATRIKQRSIYHGICVSSDLTHLSLASLLWDIGKQNSPRCDAAERGIPSGAILFAY